ncbi:hypothetical protein GOA89_28865 [Sinorhizobium meliloti]|nr:hypothetical protein [Sinorhizobium meliloti]MDW9850213.1 hypothetical protein [Sinorhizobium meliloti]MDX0147001.1 hypothetical protein [Sinorhizobium meliloti]MDX0153334.1 hypothetical protein [Sinorhizobium meliloti]MDX0172122.1 hypothetical protein [Sinorhizobium meliloti]
MPRPKRVYFLGAGASVPDGYPITAWLSCAVGAFLKYYREMEGQQSRLESYLASVYGLDRGEMDASAEMWGKYVDDELAFSRPFQSALPEIIDLLSMLDLAIVENASFGPGGDEKRRRQFRGNELVRVRERAVEALVTGFGQVQRSRRQKHDSRHPVAENFVTGLTDDDIVVTTNWDTLIEEASRSNNASAAIDYGVDLIRVDASGRRTEQVPAGSTVLKLHGSFSWLHCPCCENLYSNRDLMVAPQPTRSWPYDLECDCGAELVGVLITPTYLKNFQIPQLSEIWRKAQKSLEEADEWTFMGYSLPTDDLWIRGMLMRAFAIRRNKRDLPAVRVVCRGKNKDLEQRYKRLLKGTELKFFRSGVKDFVESRQHCGQRIEASQG